MMFPVINYDWIMRCVHVCVPSLHNPQLELKGMLSLWLTCNCNAALRTVRNNKASMQCVFSACCEVLDNHYYKIAGRDGLGLLVDGVLSLNQLYVHCSAGAHT